MTHHQSPSNELLAQFLEHYEHAAGNDGEALEFLLRFHAWAMRWWYSIQRFYMSDGAETVNVLAEGTRVLALPFFKRNEKILSPRIGECLCVITWRLVDDPNVPIPALTMVALEVARLKHGGVAGEQIFSTPQFLSYRARWKAIVESSSPP